MDNAKNSKGTPSKDTGAKNNNSNNDVDFTYHKKTDSSSQLSTSNKMNDKTVK
jgi:hypothetical protein